MSATSKLTKSRSSCCGTCYSAAAEIADKPATHVTSCSTLLRFVFRLLLLLIIFNQKWKLNAANEDFNCVPQKPKARMWAALPDAQNDNE